MHAHHKLANGAMQHTAAISYEDVVTNNHAAGRDLKLVDRMMMIDPL
jgi:hypothetical protein